MIVKVPCPQRRSPTLPTEKLSTYVDVPVHDLMQARAVTVLSRPSPAPTCCNVELPAIAVVRHLLGRRSEAEFLAEVSHDWHCLVPVLPCQHEPTAAPALAGGRSSSFRTVLAARRPETTANRSIPAPGHDLVVRFGRDAARAWSNA